MEESKTEHVEPMEPHGDERGNTGIARLTRQIQCKYWCFTWNNYTLEHVEQMEQVFRGECDWFVFQEEIGEESGTIHLQGTICLKTKQRLNQLKCLNTSIHWEKTKCVKSSIAYCSKEQTRAPNGKQWVYGINIPEPIKITEPYGWQLQVLNIINEEPDDRTINWFWEPVGKVGKSSLCKWLVVKHNAFYIMGGCASDIANRIIKNGGLKSNIFIIDLPRSRNHISYSTLESIKNGLLATCKYEGGQLVFNPPHIFVFANNEPVYDALSTDRWNVIKIDVTMRQ